MKTTPSVSGSLVVIGGLLGTSLFSSSAAALPRLVVSEDGHTLVQAANESGATRPFFWQADTAWNLASLCVGDTDGDGVGDIDQYLQDRVAKGFNVIQGPIIIRAGSFDDPTLVPDCNGNVALSSALPGAMTLNDAYLAHIDFIVNRAHELGLYVALPVIWGTVLDRYFSVDSPADAFLMGQQLAQRYTQDNVIWIVAGEYHKVAWESVVRDRIEPTARELELVRQLALGLESVHQGAQLMTVHPEGGRSSSEHFHNEPWLDFNMIQTFEIAAPLANLVADDWQRTPPKPTLNAEPAYEERDAQFINDPTTALKTRYEAYHAVFQGAFGHAYGHMDVWQFVLGWQAALDAEGAFDMRHLRALVESRPISGRMPDQALIVGDAGDYAGLSMVRATRAADGGFAFVYFPNENITTNLDLSRLSGTVLNAWWYNPRDGLTYDGAGQPAAVPFASFSTTSVAESFDPPGVGTEQDWVLVLDDAARNFAPPREAGPVIPPPDDGGVPPPDDGGTPPPDNGGTPPPSEPGAPFTIGEVIEAEDFDAGGQNVGYYDLTTENTLNGNYRPGESVDIESGRGASNGFSVGLAQPGEWLRYTVEIPASGVYDVEIRSSQPLGGGSFHLDFNGSNVTGAIFVLPTGDPQNWEIVTVRGVALTAGVQQMRVVPDRIPEWAPDIGNLDWFRITPSTAPVLKPRPPAPPVVQNTNQFQWR